MATGADVATKVLDGLRRSATFAPNTNEYHAFLLQLINAAMNETQEAWDWHALRKTATITGSAGTAAYDVDSGGAADIDLGPDARLMWEKRLGGAYADATETSVYVAGAQPQFFDTTDTQEFRLDYVSPETMERLHIMDDDDQQKPTKFTYYSDADDLIVKVWPTPSSVRTWKARFIDPQADMAKTDTFASVTMQVPIRPIWMRALAWAYLDRGEDNPAFTMESADYALQSAIARERSMDDDTGYPV